MDIQSITYNEDCLIGMKQFPDNYFELAVVDPPYGINAPNWKMGQSLNRNDGSVHKQSTAVKVKGRLNSGGGKLKNRILNTSDVDWDNEIPGPEYFEELFRVSKNQIIWGGNYFPLPPTRCIICWDKMQPWDNFSQWEMAWTSFDKPAKMYRIAVTGGNNTETKIHPTQKPIRLYDKIFKDFAAPGIKVLDTHLGSGSSRISAAKANLHFTAFEKSKLHFYDQENRYNDFILKPRIEFIEHKQEPNLNIEFPE